LFRSLHMASHYSYWLHFGVGVATIGIVTLGVCFPALY
jgi:hypothetical protein